MACRYGHLRHGNTSKQYCSITGDVTVPNGSGDYFELADSEIGTAQDLTFRLHNPVAQPELRYQGFIWHGPCVPGDAVGKY